MIVLMLRIEQNIIWGTCFLNHNCNSHSQEAAGADRDAQTKVINRAIKRTDHGKLAVVQSVPFFTEVLKHKNIKHRGDWMEGALARFLS